MADSRPKRVNSETGDIVDASSCLPAGLLLRVASDFGELGEDGLQVFDAFAAMMHHRGLGTFGREPLPPGGPMENEND
jgi:hypothetical protein